MQGRLLVKTQPALRALGAGQSQAGGGRAGGVWTGQRRLRDNNNSEGLILVKVGRTSRQKVDMLNLYF